MSDAGPALLKPKDYHSISQPPITTSLTSPSKMITHAGPYSSLLSHSSTPKEEPFTLEPKTAKEQ